MGGLGVRRSGRGFVRLLAQDRGGRRLGLGVGNDRTLAQNGRGRGLFFGATALGLLLLLLLLLSNDLGLPRPAQPRRPACCGPGLPATAEQSPACEIGDLLRTY